MQSRISPKWFLIIILFLVLGLLAYGFYLKKSGSLSISQTTPKMSYHTNIIKDTAENEYFRKVLFTGANSQLVVMSIPPGGEVGAETHKYTEQTLFFFPVLAKENLMVKSFQLDPAMWPL